MVHTDNDSLLLHSITFLGPTYDTEKDLSALFQLWLDSKDLVVKVLTCTLYIMLCLPVLYK